LGVFIFGVGVGPFLVKFRLAAADKTLGTDLLDLHRFGPAQIRLERSAGYFENIGLLSRSTDAKLGLIQSYVGIGDFAGADELIAQLEKSGTLDEDRGGKLHGIRGNITYQRGEFEIAEREYQLARQSIKPASLAYADLLQNQAVLWSNKGRPFRDQVLANYEGARKIYQELKDTGGLADVSINEGNLYENDPEAARTHYERARLHAEQAQHAFLLGVANLNIGVTFRRESNLDQAEEHYRNARKWFEEAADLSGQANVELNLAVVEQVRGRMELARQHLNSSEAYLRSVDRETSQISPRIEARMLTFQADIYDQVFGETEEAEIRYKQALSIYRNHPDPLREAATLVNYGGMLAKLNRGEEARNQLEQAREIGEEYADEGPNLLVGVLHNNLGRVYQDIGDNDTALYYYQESRKTFRELGEQLLYAEAVENIGGIHGFLGDGDRAIKSLEEALAIYRESKNRDREAQALFNLYAISRADDLPLASESVSEILTLLQEYNIDQEVESSILFGILLHDIGDEAWRLVYRERLHQLRRFYERRDDPVGLGRAHQKLANVEQLLGNLDQMVAHAREAEKYVNEIQLPLRISVHSDLGFFLVYHQALDSPEDALGHFYKAFDLARNYDVVLQRRLAGVIYLYTTQYVQDIECDKHLSKARSVVNSTNDAEIRGQFQEILDILNPLCG
jgi:tetratricopeptide (TPR) repeat protein